MNRFLKKFYIDYTFLKLEIFRNAAGGCVLLYVRNDLKAKVLVKSKTSQKGKPKKIIFCAIWSKRGTRCLTQGP